MTATDAPKRLRCECGTELSLAPRLPDRRRLVHRRRLEELAAQAERAEAGGDLPAALVAWREALELLPAESSQARRIADRVTAARAQAPAASLEAAARR
ncbi:MAG: hypothetical protein R2862_13300 [Thermoanaerobaculia bacterium]